METLPATLPSGFTPLSNRPMVLLNERGLPLSVSEFSTLVRKADAVARPLPQAFPAGSSFWDFQGVPVVQDSLGFCRALDGSFVASAMLLEMGTPISETAYRALAVEFRART